MVRAASNSEERSRRGPGGGSLIGGNGHACVAVQQAADGAKSMLSLTNETLPSHSSTWRARVHAEDFAVRAAIAVFPQAIAGTSGGRAVVVDEALEAPALPFDGPEMLIDLSGSAQRFAARPANVPKTGSVMIGSALLPAAIVGSELPMPAPTFG